MLSVADQAAWRHLPSSVEVVTPPTETGVLSLADVRAHVAQPLLDDDVQLQAMQEAAERVVESRLARPLFAQTRRAWYDGVPGSVIRLSEPAVAVTSVVVYGEDDVALTVSGTVYRADVTSEPARVLLRPGQSWPSAMRRRQALAVTYTTGWARKDIPRNIRLAIAMLVAHWYEQRAPLQAAAVTEVPYGIEALLQPHCLVMGVA